MDKLQLIAARLGAGLEEFIPNLAMAASTLLLGVLLAFALKRLTWLSVNKVGISTSSRLPSWFSSFRSRQLADSLARGIFWFTILIFVIFSSEIFGFDVVSHWVGLVNAYLPKIIGAFAVLVTGGLLARIVRDVITRSGRTAGIKAAHGFALICYIVGISVTVLITIKQLGIEIEFLTTGVLVVLACLLAGGAISFGMGSAPVVTNILSAFYAQRIVKLGSVVVVEGIRGKVIEVTSTSFVLQTESSRLIIPGKKMNDAIVEVMNVQA